jgi:hypothetical protein
VPRVGPITLHAAPVITFATRRPFSRADAISAGIDPQLLEGSRFRRIFRGVHVAASVEVTPQVRAAAALVPFDATAFASHASAARIHRVPIPTIPDEHVTVLERRHRRQRDGIRCHLAARATVRMVGGVRVSDYPQMFVELGELLPLVDLVVGDNLVRTGRTRPEALLAFCEKAAGPGARLARTAVEYDGRHHIEREAQWESDLERREAIDNDNHRLLVVTAKGIYAEPERTLLRIWRVLRARREPAVPARLADAWRPHSPVRDRAA